MTIEHAARTLKSDILRCHYCGHEQLVSRIVHESMKFHPPCMECGKPVEIVRIDHEQPDP